MYENYPVGIPYRPPEPRSAQGVRWKRWIPALIGVGLLSAIAGAGGTLWWLTREDRKETALPETAANPQAGTTLPTSASPQDLLKSASTAGNSSQKLAATAPAPRALAASLDRLLDALGGLSGAHLSQTLLNLRLVADGVEKQIYTKEEGEKILASLVDLMDQVEDYLEDLQELDLKAEEKQTIKRIQKVSDALRRQVTALRAYWQTGGVEQLAAYRAARQAALEALGELLKQP